jgi:hypothetical protein
MVCLWVATEAGTASAVARFFESFGCQVIEGWGDHVRIGFPQASTEGEAAAEARLYMSMRPRLRGSFRLAVATVIS